jgi:hypothetical protein
MISRSDIDDAVAGHVDGMLLAALASSAWFHSGFGPSDIPKPALASMRRDVTAFVKRNERSIRSAMDRLDLGIVERRGWDGVGRDFADVRNSNIVRGAVVQTRGATEVVRLSDLGWRSDDYDPGSRPNEAVRKLDEAAWAFPKTAIYVEEYKPGFARLGFWEESRR